MQVMIRRWIYNAVSDGPWAEWVALRLKHQVEYGKYGDAATFLAKAPWSEEYLLDIVDAILSLGGPWPTEDGWRMHNEPPANKRALAALAELLDIAQSVYCVNAARDGLARRADAAATAAFQQASLSAASAPSAGSSAEHLSNAWSTLHALRPDPSRAYSEAIKAVEAAAHAIVQPNHAKATLGTMLGELKNASHKFSLAIPGPTGSGDVAPLVAMIELLWTGQTSRHGAQTPTRTETREEADMAVHLAVTLVQWFAAGAIIRKP
jgi:hypothetical protein